MSLYPVPSSSKNPLTQGKTEFEILKASHKFLREDDEVKTYGSSWDDQLAAKYYDSLFREFAVCDLKHYKSGNFSLRWRTESEVLSGAGETTCGNTRCAHHDARSAGGRVQLTTLELPFAYTEHGEPKSALVKVVLCAKCVGKLMWKRRKEKERLRVEEQGDANATGEERESKDRRAAGPRTGETDDRDRGREPRDADLERRHRRRHSRSRSPPRKDNEREQARQRAPPASTN